MHQLLYRCHATSPNLGPYSDKAVAKKLVLLWQATLLRYAHGRFEHASARFVQACLVVGLCHSLDLVESTSSQTGAF